MCFALIRRNACGCGPVLKELVWCSTPARAGSAYISCPVTTGQEIEDIQAPQAGARGAPLPIDLLALLRCLECGGAVRLVSLSERPGYPELGPDGRLRCEACGESYPLIAGTARMLVRTMRARLPVDYPLAREAFDEEPGADPAISCDDSREVKQRTVDSFAYEWQRFGALREQWRKNFIDYMQPHSPESFEGRLLLDVGTGSGRHAFHARVPSPRSAQNAGSGFVTRTDTIVHRIPWRQVLPDRRGYTAGAMPDEPHFDLSVVVPVWDSYVDRYLDDALTSLLSNGRPREILVIDNASATPVPERNGVRVVCTERRLTVGAARNLGLAEAEGEYVMFWDADDMIVPGILGRLRASMEDRRVIAATASIIDADTGERHHWPRPWTRTLTRWPKLFALINCVSALFPTTGSTVIRTDAARAAGGFGDTDGGDDWMLGVSLALRGRIAFVSDPGRLYRRHPDSLSARWRTVPNVTAHAARVLGRLARDPAAKGPVRLAIPVIAAAQTFVLLVLRPVGRRLRGRGVRA